MFTSFPFFFCLSFLDHFLAFFHNQLFYLFLQHWPCWFIILIFFSLYCSFCFPQSITVVVPTPSRTISQWYTDFLIPWTTSLSISPLHPTSSFPFAVFLRKHMPLSVFWEVWRTLGVFWEFKAFAFLILGIHMFVISELVKFGLCVRTLLSWLFCMIHGMSGEMPSASMPAHSFSCIFIVFAILPI